MHKKISILLLNALIALILTSCYDAVEIDEQAFVMTVGIDEGISNKWRVTLQIPTMQSEAGGGTGGGGQSTLGGKGAGYTVVTIEAPSFVDAINMFESSIPRRLSFEHMKFIVISKGMAKSGKLGEYIAPIRRYRQIRNSSHVIIARGSADEFVNELEPLIGVKISKSQELFFIIPGETAYFPHVMLEDLYDGFKSTYRQPIAVLGGVNNFNNIKETGEKWGTEFKPGGGYLAGQLPRKGGSSIELFGTAVFDGDTMVGELNGDETRLMLIGRGEFERGFFGIPDPKKPELLVPLDVRLKKSNRKVSAKIENGKPNIHLKLDLEGDILAVQSRINYESPELKPVLEKAFEQYIKTGLDELISKTKALKVDILQFGRKAVWNFNTIQEWEKYNWIVQYKKADVTTEVSFTIRRTGTMLNNSPVLTTEGRE
jgi:spore germination protein KC